MTVEQVQAAAVKYLTPSNRTIGWFEPAAHGVMALNPRRVVLRQRRHRHRQVQSHHAGGEHAGWRAHRRLCRSARSRRHRGAVRARARSRHRDAVRGGDRRRSRRPRRVAVGRGRPPPDGDRRDLPDGGFSRPVLALAADMARHPRFADEEIATRRENLITSIRQEEDNPASMAGGCVHAGALRRSPLRAQGARHHRRASKRSAARIWCGSTRRASTRRRSR